MRNTETSKLKARRMARDLSQADLAALAGINARMLQYYEQGAKDLCSAKLATLLKICLALHCRLEDILPDSETAALLEQYIKMA